MSLVAIDTNILFYAFSDAEVSKQKIAVDVLWRTAATGILSLQALAEFFAVVSRKMPEAKPTATAYIDLWSTVFRVVDARLSDLGDAIELNRGERIPFWDAMLLACYRREGASVLLTEDFQEGRDFGGLRIINPFRADVGGMFGLHERAPAWRGKTTKRKKRP